MQVSSINQDPFIHVEVSRFFNMKGTAFMIDLFKDVVDVIVHYSYSIEPFFYSGGGEFIVIVEVYSA